MEKATDTKQGSKADMQRSKRTVEAQVNSQVWEMTVCGLATNNSKKPNK